MRFEEKIDMIKEELKKPLPGKSRHLMMSPEFRGAFESDSPAKEAAVMICIFPGDQDLQLVFMKRSEYDGPHGGQISFPGGIYEESDKDLIETAIRETREEIGLDCNNSSVIGALTPLLIPISNINVQPYVSFHNRKPAYSIDKREVEFLIEAPIAELLNPLCIQREQRKIRDKIFDVPFYKVAENIIWGATAMILSEFLAVIANSGLYPQFQYSGNGRSET